MASVIGAILALYGVGDLFAGVGRRALPWWGDLIAIATGAVILIVAKALNHD